MRETVSEIVIRGTPDQIMDLAFNLPRWPSFLPHYRWVRVLDRQGDLITVEMACWRGWMPLRWRSELWVDRPGRTMRFRHVGGPARGMDVVWTLDEETEAGEASAGVKGVRVRIRHDLSLRAPVIRSTLGRWVVGEVFVKAVASRTLASLKSAVEAGTATFGKGAP